MSSLNNTKLFSILISLSSLDINNNEYKISGLSEETQQITVYIYYYNFKFYKNSQLSALTFLKLINYIYTCSFKEDIYKKICTILYSSSTSYTSNHQRNQLIKDKYILRFLYQYEKHYKYNFNHENNFKKLHILRITSMKNLYVLYRSISEQNAYILYKYIK